MCRIDDEKFAESIVNSRKKLYKCAYYYLGNKEDAMEAVQEVSYRGYKYRKKFRGTEENLDKWLIKILVNYCRDIYKKRKRIVPFKDMELVMHENHQARAFSLDSNYDTFEMIQGIDSPYKEIVILRFIQDLKIKDIAAIMKKPESTIKSQIKKAKDILMNIYCKEA